MVLVGIGDATSAREPRRVLFAEGLALANTFGCQYIEVDTDMGTGAEKPFAMAIKEIRDASRTMKYHQWLYFNECPEFSTTNLVEESKHAGTEGIYGIASSA